jgi:sirohydrochlorin ferrochelatase
MSEPALVVLAHGSRDPRSAATIRQAVTTLRTLDPGLPVRAAFLDHNGPDLATVVEELARKGPREIVVVPLFLTSAYHARVDSPAALDRVQERHPDIRLRLAEVVGSDPLLLTALDERLRDAVRPVRGDGPDALVLASAGSSDTLANAETSRLAELWGARHDLPATVAFASTVSPSAADAVRRWRSAGYRRVAVGSWFIAPGTLPDRVRSSALEAGAFAVTEPLGPHVLLCKVIRHRYLASASTFAVLV